MFFESLLRTTAAQKQHRNVKKVELLFLRFGYNVHRLSWLILHPRAVGCRVMILSGSKVLLVKHTYNHRYFFPGGLVEFGEDLKEAGAREVLEETGLTIDPQKIQLAGIYRTTSEGKDNTLILFWVQMDTPVVVSVPPDRWYELAEIGWYDIDDLPKMSAQSTRNAIADYKNREFPVIKKW